MHTRPVFRSLLISLLAVALCWSAFQSLTDALIRAQWFELTSDEALHGELIASFAETGRYQAWSGTPFAPALTTGPTVILPAALLARVTGMPATLAGRATLFFYHLFFLGVLAAIAVRLLREGANPVTRPIAAVTAVLAIGLLHQGWRGMTETSYYLFGILGEGAVAFYVALCVWFLVRSSSPEKRDFLGAGLAAMLAVLSKPTLMFFPVLFFLLTLFTSETRRHTHWVTLGLAAPLAAGAAWMLTTLGPTGFTDWWIQYPKIMRALNGAGIPTHQALQEQGFFGLVLERLREIPEIVRPRALILAISGFAAGAWFSWRGAKPQAFAFKLLLTFGILHFSWWLFLSPGKVPRYLFPAMLAGWIAFVTWATPALARKFSRLPFRALPVALLLVGVTSVFALRVGAQWIANHRNWKECAFCRELEFQSYWKSLSAQERPVFLWSTSTGVANDREMFLSAPYSLVSESDSKHGGPPSGAWVAVGAHARAGTHQWIAANACQPIFTLPGPNGPEGFWTCEEKPGKTR